MLEFSAISEHAVCDDCNEFKRNYKGLNRPRSEDVAASAFKSVQKYQQHLNLVFRDRSMVWSIFEQAQHSALGDAFIGPPFVLAFADGTDQAKWRLPRYPGLQATHKM